MKILLKAAYDGRNYCGWQVQKNGVSVQGEICRAAKEAYGVDVKVTGCSRTDSGVHALAYCFTLETPDGAPSIPLSRNFFSDHEHCGQTSISVFSSGRIISRTQKLSSFFFLTLPT